MIDEKNEVYVVVSSDMDTGECMEGIFSTMEKAEAYKTAQEAERPSYSCCEYDIRCEEIK